MAGVTELNKYLKNSRKYKFQNNQDFCSVVLGDDTYFMDKLGGNAYPKKYNINLHKKGENKPVFISCLDPKQTLLFFQSVLRKDKVNTYLDK